MAIIFREKDHIYESIDENLEKDNITWTSVTSFISKFKPKFNAKAQAKKSCKKDLNLSDKFKSTCEQMPYLPQCKVYDI